MKTYAEPADVPVYERRLDEDGEWAMDEGDRFFRGDSEALKSMRILAQRLDDLGVSYAVLGGMALNAHGFRRFTDDVDVRVTRDGLTVIRANLDTFGLLAPIADGKTLRDTERGVRIDFFVAGTYPGDRKPKPVAFPEPGCVAVKLGEVNYINLPTLVDLKLASGMTNFGRMMDLADVQEVIKAPSLSRDFAEELSPYVRAKYAELWDGIHALPDDPWADRDWRE